MLSCPHLFMATPRVTFPWLLVRMCLCPVVTPSLSLSHPQPVLILFPSFSCPHHHPSSVPILLPPCASHAIPCPSLDPHPVSIPFPILCHPIPVPVWSLSPSLSHPNPNPVPTLSRPVPFSPHPLPCPHTKPCPVPIRVPSRSSSLLLFVSIPIPIPFPIPSPSHPLPSCPTPLPSHPHPRIRRDPFLAPSHAHSLHPHPLLSPPVPSPHLPATSTRSAGLCCPPAWKEETGGLRATPRRSGASTLGAGAPPARDGLRCGTPPHSARRPQPPRPPGPRLCPQ